MKKTRGKKEKSYYLEAGSTSIVTNCHKKKWNLAR